MIFITSTILRIQGFSATFFGGSGVFLKPHLKEVSRKNNIPAFSGIPIGVQPINRDCTTQQEQNKTDELKFMKDQEINPESAYPMAGDFILASLT